MTKQLYSLGRQAELIAINRVLAALVVGLTFTTGYLLALRQEWFIKPQPQISEPPVMSMAVNAVPISAPANSPFVALLKLARYDRDFSNTPLSTDTLSSLVWAAQGKITSWGERTVPSYKSEFPLTLFVVVRQVPGVVPGIYTFNPLTQSLEPAELPLPTSLADTLPGLTQAPVILGVSTEATHRGDSLALIEAGGVAQNILLGAKSWKLMAYFIPASALADTETTQFTLPDQTLLWLMPISLDTIQANTTRKP